MKTVPASRAHDEWLHAQLKDPTFAAEFLATAATDDPAVYLLALRQVAEAHGMATIAKAAGIPRESLYRALGPNGNPRLSTLTAIMRAAGMTLSAATSAKPKKAAKRPAAVKG
jgi:probable addiction module antidote protein